MLLIKNGRVLDPASGTDSARDILLDGERVVAFARMQQQTPAHQSLVDSFQPFKLYFTDLNIGSGLDVKGQVEHMLVRILEGDGRVHLGERIALILERGQEPRTAREHLVREGRRT